MRLDTGLERARAQILRHCPVRRSSGWRVMPEGAVERPKAVGQLPPILDLGSWAGDFATVILQE